MFSTSDIYTLARKAASAVEGEGAGHTVYAHGVSPRRYVVGGYTKSLLFPINEGTARIRKAVRALAASTPARFAETLGMWEDKGTVYVDLGTTYHSEVSALSVARTRGELAIYDRETGECIAIS